MEVLQIISKELTPYTETKRKSKHGKHKLNYHVNYYAKNKQKYLLAKQKYRSKLKANKPAKLPSPFQQTKQTQLLKYWLIRKVLFQFQLN